MLYIINKSELEQLFTLYSEQKDIFACVSPFAFKRVINTVKGRFKSQEIHYQSLFFANLFLASFIHANNIQVFLELIKFIKKKQRANINLSAFVENHQFINKPYVTQFAPKLYIRDLAILLNLYHLLRIRK